MQSIVPSVRASKWQCGLLRSSEAVHFEVRIEATDFRIRKADMVRGGLAVIFTPLDLARLMMSTAFLEVMC